MRELFKDEIKVSTIPSTQIPIHDRVACLVADVPSDLAHAVDVAHAKAIANLSPVTADQIDKLGDQYATKLSANSQKLLSQVKAKDAEILGTQMTKIIGIAKGFDASKFKDKGLITKISGIFGSVKERLLAEYSSVEKRIDEVVVQIDANILARQSSIPQLEEMYTANYSSYQGLQFDIGAADQMIATLNVQLDHEKAITNPDSFAAQRISDVEGLIRLVQVKKRDLQGVAMLSMQMAPEIRLLQENARTLVTKFKNLKQITIPAWKQLFMLYLIQLDQKKSVELANEVDATTNQFLTSQSDLLRHNSKAIAEAGERAAISYETLDHMQQQLIGTLDDVAAEYEKGRQKRAETEPKIKALEQQLIDRFTRKT
jgi:uncharacterized protein YaaN involved in tellurite resistance